MTDLSALSAEQLVDYSGLLKAKAEEIEDTRKAIVRELLERGAVDAQTSVDGSAFRATYVSGSVSFPIDRAKLVKAFGEDGIMKYTKTQNRAPSVQITPLVKAAAATVREAA